MDAPAPDAVLAQVVHHQGARQHQFLQDLNEALDEAGGVVFSGVEPGDGVTQGGLQQALLQGRGQALARFPNLVPGDVGGGRY